MEGLKKGEEKVQLPYSKVPSLAKNKNEKTSGCFCLTSYFL